MDLLDRIKIEPDKCNGKPTIRGLRITVMTVLGYLAAGDTKEEILENYPDLEAEDIDACLLYAAKVLSQPESFYAMQVSH